MGIIGLWKRNAMNRELFELKIKRIIALFEEAGYNPNEQLRAYTLFN